MTWPFQKRRIVRKFIRTLPLTSKRTKFTQVHKDQNLPSQGLAILKSPTYDIIVTYEIQSYRLKVRGSACTWSDLVGRHGVVVVVGLRAGGGLRRGLRLRGRRRLHRRLQRADAVLLLHDH